MKKIGLVILTILAQSLFFSVSAVNPPTGLTVNFLAHSGQVFLNGYPVEISLDEAVHRRENFQFARSGKTPLLWMGGFIGKKQRETVGLSAFGCHFTGVTPR